jgi:hypothetical protein
MEQEPEILIEISEYDDYAAGLETLERVSKLDHYNIMKSCVESKRHRRANCASLSKEFHKGKLFLTKFHQMFNKTTYQKYNITDDVTYTSISVTQPTPKWLVKAIETMVLKPNFFGMYDFTFIVNDVKYIINMHSTNFHMEFETKGLAFIDSYDMIRFYKSRTPMFYALKANFKTNISRFLQECDEHCFMKQGVIVFDGNFAKDILGY